MNVATHPVDPRAVEVLANPAFHGDGTTSVQRRETHTSWVLLAGERAYKVKKPVSFAFLDQRTLAQRRAACLAELELNRPLAPDVYRAVCALVPGGPHGLRLTDADDPAAVEYVVEMRRFDEDATLAALARRGALGDADLIAVAGSRRRRRAAAR